MSNQVVKVYSVDGGISSQTFTPPAGVKQVQMTLFTAAKRQSTSVSQNSRIELTAAGVAYGWGTNAAGGLGDNSVTVRSSPVAVVGGIKFQKIAVSQHTLGLDFLGRCWAWGANTTGELGDGTVVGKSSPVQVQGNLIFKDIANGRNTSLGLLTDGRLYAWGNGGAGGLGDNTQVSKSSPVAVVGGLRFASIAVGENSSYAIDEFGNAYAWGSNVNGQLGDNTVAAKSSPVAVVGGLSFAKLAAGNGANSFSAGGITTTGAAYCWGNNLTGELGDNSIVPKSSPVAVVGGLTFKDLAFSESGAIAVDNAGNAYCWGSGKAGQLGQNTAVTSTTAVSSPVAVVGGLSFVAVGTANGANGGAKAGTHFGITAAGAMYAWGANISGQIADGTVVAKSSPVLVVGGLAFVPRIYTQVGTYNIAVTPNTAYAIDFSAFIFTFNSVAYLPLISRVEFKYSA